MFKNSDWRLIQKALSGSERCWSKLVRRYQNEVYNHAFRMTGSEQDAFDLMQEIFLSVFRNLPGFRGDAKFRTWLYRIASNRSIDFLRKRKLPTTETDINDLSEHSEDLMNSNTNSNENTQPQYQLLQQQQTNRIILQLMEQLSPDHRCILELKFYQQFTFDEISQQLGIPSNTVKTRFYSSLGKMKNIAEKAHVKSALV